MSNATIFFNDSKWLANEQSGVFDYRFEGQALPAGSVVVGFITRDGELLDPPHFPNEGQAAEYERMLAEARAEVN